MAETELDADKVLGSGPRMTWPAIAPAGLLGRAAVAALLASLAAWALKAEAHDAPSGWSYEQDCCSGEDCAEIPDSAVRVTRDGFVITLRKEQHPSLTRDMTYRIGHGDGRIRNSGDEHYHACIARDLSLFELFGSMQQHEPAPPAHRLICFYRPQGWS